MLNYPKGCLTQYETAVGYYPCRTSADTMLRTGPGRHFRAVRQVKAGKRFGWQSVANPDRINTPRRRPKEKGFVWGYILESGHTGWIEASALRDDTETASKCWADGPAGEDFQVGCGSPKPKRKPRFTVGWRPKTKQVKRTVKANEVYIRYSVRGAAKGYLLKGDEVKIRWVSPFGFVWIEVLDSYAVKPGSTGWVFNRALKK